MFNQIVKGLGAMILISAVTGCVPLDNQYGYGSSGSYYPNSGYPSSGGYYDPSYRNDPYYRDDRRDVRRERERLEEERERLEDERERLERERQREVSRPAPRPQEERCPPGFSPSENKCSHDERKRGCRDMRLPGGLGCVSR